MFQYNNKRLLFLLLLWLFEHLEGSQAALRASAVLRRNLSLESFGRQNSVLHQSVLREKVDIVKLLLQVGTDVNPTWSESTPLHTAIYTGNNDIVKLRLTQETLNFLGQMPIRHTPLSLAKMLDKPELAKLLMDKMVAGSEYLFKSIKAGDVDQAYLALNGADLNKKDERGRSTLSYAAGSWNIDMVKWLVEDAGVDVDTKDDDGSTALARAADNGDQEIVDYLVEKGASLDSRDVVGRTPLFRAATRGHWFIVTYLVRMGADVNSKTHFRVTPISEAKYL